MGMAAPICFDTITARGESERNLGFEVAPRDTGNLGEAVMGDKGSKDKGKREAQKKALLTPKEKRKQRQEKKNKTR